jgi:hypothetical protein
METVLTRLKTTFQDITFEPGDTFFWSPKNQKITYDAGAPPTDQHATWALLHETAHALLGHKKYQYDVDLLLLEVEAWQRAKGLAESFGITIEEDHIQDCLDTYRDWLHQRATCPRCSTVSLQIPRQDYRCHNCAATWTVSSSRFCRPYRLTIG